MPTMTPPPRLVRVLVAALLSLGCPAPAALGVEAQQSPPMASITLRSGDVLRGTLVRETADAVTLEHPELGTITIPTRNLLLVAPYDPEPGAPSSSDDGDPASGEGSATAAGAEGDDPSAVKGSGAPEPPKSPWDYYLSIAFGGSFNTNDEFSFRGGAGMKYEREPFKVSVDGEYYFRVLNEDNVDNNLLINAIEEWTIGTTPWFLFGQQQYQYDEFQSWEHRISLYGGPGYRLIRRDDLALTLRAGAGATYEVGPDEWTPQALLAEEFMWKISERQKFTFDASIAPSFEDINDYLLQVAAEYALAVDNSKKGLALTFGVRDIYDSKPASGSKHNDLRFYGGLRYDF